MPNKKRILFLINPRSGGQNAQRIFGALRQYAESVDGDIQVEELNSDLFLEGITQLTNDIVVIGGGDGTFSTLLPYLASMNSTVGILPLGTGNDLAKELGLTNLLGWSDAARIVRFYREAACREITYFNLEYGENYSSKSSFINYVSFGFDAKVVADFAKLRELRWWHSFRGIWGNRLGYAGLCLTNVMHEIVSSTAFTIKNMQDTHTFHNAKSIIFTNIRSMMGLGKSNLHSSIFDENVECVVVNSVMNYLTMVSHYRLPVLHPRFIGSSSRWELLELPMGVPIQIDGEHRPDIKSNRYRINKGGKLSLTVGSDHL